MADLTTLAAVKALLVVSSTNQDALIASLISRESRLIEQWTGRRFPVVTNTARRLDGTGTSMLMLPDGPILSIESLTIGGVAIALSADGIAAGYTFDDSTIYLTGGARFPMGRQNVVCTWTAGYEDSQTEDIPTANVPTLSPSNGGAAFSTISVTAANGAAFTEVANAPVASQYSFANGTYTFNTSDAGTEVTMAYRCVPGPVAMACIEMVGLDLKVRDNFGVTSKTLSGETISYTEKGMTASVKELLQPYRKVCPV